MELFINMRKNSLPLLFLLFGAVYGVFGQSTTQYFRHIKFTETPLSPFEGIYPLKEADTKDLRHFRFFYDEEGRLTEVAYYFGEKPFFPRGGMENFFFYAPSIKFEYAENKVIKRYFNEQGQPVPAYRAFWQEEVLYANGRPISLIYQDKEGKPVQNHWGIQQYNWEYLSPQQVVETRLNSKGEQVSIRPNLEFVTTLLDFRENGNLQSFTNVDADHNPLNNNTGVAQDRIQYDDRGNFVGWQLNNQDGQKIIGNPGLISGGIRKVDQNGNLIQTAYIDPEGKVMANKWGIAYSNQAFDDHGNMTLVEFRNEQGELIVNPNYGLAKLKSQYEGILLTRQVFYDANDTPFIAPMHGTACEERIYDNGRLSKVFFKDADGNLMNNQNQKGAAILEFVFNPETGRRKVVRYDKDGKPIE